MIALWGADGATVFASAIADVTSAHAKASAAMFLDNSLIRFSLISGRDIARR
jgi:hypothetical protein